MAVSTDEIERAFALIEAAALKGERAPMTHPYGPLRSIALAELYRTRRIRGEIFAKNFRRFTLLTGPNAGKCTASPHPPSPPYRVVDHRGSTYPGRFQRRAVS